MSRCRRDCLGRFSVRHGTVVQSSRLSLQTWSRAPYLLSTGLNAASSVKLRRDFGAMQETARYLARRLRGVISENGPVH